MEKSFYVDANIFIFAYGNDENIGERCRKIINLVIEPYIIVTLQCTTPGIRPKDIDELVRMVDEDFDSAATICEVSEKPEWMYYYDQKTKVIKSIMNIDISGDVGVRQTLKPKYRLTGAGYASCVNMIEGKNAILFGGIGGLTMPRSRSVDIDDIYTFNLAEYIAKEYW